MKTQMGIVSLVLVLMAASSLVSMISILRIDSIVHGDLYDFGLEFSYRWAVPYWTMTTIVFGVGWFNIIASIAFQFYILLYGRKETVEPEIPKPAPTPPKEAAPETEAKPPEKVEDTIEALKEQTVTPTPEPETIEKMPEETPPPTEVTETPSQQQEPSETIPVEAEEQKPPEPEPQPTEEPGADTQETPETPPTTTQTEQQTTLEKSEESVPLVGVPEEQPQTTTEGTPPSQPQSTGTS